MAFGLLRESNFVCRAFAKRFTGNGSQQRRDGLGSRQHLAHVAAAQLARHRLVHVLADEHFFETIQGGSILERVLDLANE